MPLFQVRLELARTPEFPAGSSAHGYDLVIPLLEDGRLDAEAWRDQRRRCTVARFWPGEKVETGYLIRTRGGAWALSYAPGTDDDEPVFRLADHIFKKGEYVSVTEHDGVSRTFRVTEVKPASRQLN